MPPLIHKVRGNLGKVTVPWPGMVIGEMFQWQLYVESGAEHYTLRAQFNSVNELLWNEMGDNSRRIELYIDRDRWYEARPTPGAEIKLDGRVLVVKYVELSKLEDK